MDIIKLLGGHGISVLRAVRNQIKEKRREIAELEKVQGVLSKSTVPVVVEPKSGKRVAFTGRVSWMDVFNSLPPIFTIADVLKHPGAASKGQAQVSPAIARWKLQKLVKRVDRGQYQRLDLASAAKQKGKKKAAKRPSSKPKESQQTAAA